MKLLLLTGARRDEIARLRWSEIDLEAGAHSPARRANKERQAARHPAVPQALAILKSRPRQEGRDFVFGINGHGFVDFSGARADFDQRLDRLQIFGNSPNAGRCTIFAERSSTRLHGAPFGIQPHIVESLLGHISGHRSGVAGVYNHADYLIERRAALTRWSDAHRGADRRQRHRDSRRMLENSRLRNTSEPHANTNGVPADSVHVTFQAGRGMIGKLVQEFPSFQFRARERGSPALSS